MKGKKGFQKGHPCYLLKHTEEAKRKISLSHQGEKSVNWKGDNVGRYGLHHWVRNHLPQPELCEMCNKNKSKDLANITGIYKRDFSNWKYLCALCHWHLDIERHQSIINPSKTIKLQRKTRMINNNPMKSPITIEKMRKSLTGKKLSSEHKRNITLGQIKRWNRRRQKQ